MSAIIFCIAAVFYVLAWIYIRQLVREVNRESTTHVSMFRWNKGWSRHRTLFPDSRVRQRIVGCLTLTAILGLIALAIEARLMFLRL